MIHFSYSKPNFQSQILCPRAKKTYFGERIVNIWLQSHRNYTTRSLQFLKYFILITRILPTWDQLDLAGPGSPIRDRLFRTRDRQILVFCVGDACHLNCNREQLKCVWSVFYPIVLNWIFVVLKVNSRSWILKISTQIELNCSYG